MDKIVEPSCRNFSLDVLKSLTVCLIAVFHLFGWSGITDVVPMTLYLGVDLLFIVTGYTTMMSVCGKCKVSSLDYMKYLWKSRITRLWLPYVIIWAITILFYLIAYGDNSDLYKYTEFYSYFITFFLLQSIGFTAGGEILGNNPIGIAWPLAAEFWIGLMVFPLIHRFQKHPVRVMFASGAAAILSLEIIYTLNGLNGAQTYMGEHMGVYVSVFGLLIPIAVLRCVAGLSLGILVYYLKSIIDESIADKHTFSVAMTVIEIITLYVILRTYWKINFSIRNTVVFPFLGAVLVLLLAMEKRKGLIGIILNLRAIRWFGKLYFGIFLMHPFIVMLVTPWLSLNVPLTIIAFICLTLAAAALFHFTAEALGKSLNKKFNKL